MDKIYIVTDLGPGDGGKGGIVHALSSTVDASVIIKRGGAQGSHGVRTSYGEKFNFSQWGCGTLEGVPTYCSPQMIISPVGLENESNELKHHGIYDPFLLMSIHPSCICSTPYHMISSQLEELMLGKKPRGTIGTGVGRSYRMWQQEGDEITIRASDLKYRSAIEHKLKMQMVFYREKYKDVSSDNGIPEDVPLFKENLDLLYDDGLLDYCINLFTEIGRKIELKDFEAILKMKGTAIVECSHGVLTDNEIGLKPHVSAIRTLPIFTENMIRSSGYEGEISHLAVHRAYEIRHGAGPMPTYDPEFTSQMLPGSHKEENRWQGIVRSGPLDTNLMKYALTACKDTKFDGLCLTWFDQISGVWKICTHYRDDQIDESYTNFVMNAKPAISNFALSNLESCEETFKFVDRIVNEYVGIPLKILSIGPTEKDKLIKI